MMGTSYSNWHHLSKIFCGNIYTDTDKEDDKEKKTYPFVNRSNIHT